MFIFSQTATISLKQLCGVLIMKRSKKSLAYFLNIGRSCQKILNLLCAAVSTTIKRVADFVSWPTTLDSIQYKSVNIVPQTISQALFKIN